MTRSKIALISEDPELLSKLEGLAGSRQFVRAGECAPGELMFTIFDSTGGVEPEEGFAGLVLTESDEFESGTLRMRKSAFLSEPGPILELCERAARADEQTRVLKSEIEILSHMQELLALNDTHSLSQRVTREALQILGLPNGSMLLHDPKVERYVTTFSDDPKHVEAGEFLPGVSPSQIQQAMEEEGGYAYERPTAQSKGLLVLTIQVEHDLIGVIKVSVPADAGFDETLIPEATRYIRTVTAILRNAYLLTRSRELALRDDLTRCFNRRFFEAFVEDEMERARRYKSVLSIIFLDLDDLKLVNNAHGHMAGSRTLQEVARLIMDAVRTVDKVVRFGGDEFCIILPQTDHEQATAVASRVREAIIRRPIQLDSDIDVRITASFGIASYPLHADTKDDLITAADAAMLLVKSTTKDEIGIARTTPSKAFIDRKSGR